MQLGSSSTSSYQTESPADVTMIDLTQEDFPVKPRHSARSQKPSSFSSHVPANNSETTSPVGLQRQVESIPVIQPSRIQNLPGRSVAFAPFEKTTITSPVESAAQISKPTARPALSSMVTDAKKSQCCISHLRSCTTSALFSVGSNASPQTSQT